MKRAIALTLSIGAALILSACANTDTMLGTGSPATTSALPAKSVKPAVDPACTALSVRIDELRKAGIVERVEAASQGKSKTVSVKRASLGQIAELEKANMDFQAKCSVVPRAASVAAPPVKDAAAKVGAEKTKTAVKTAAAVAKAPAASKTTVDAKAKAEGEAQAKQ